LLSIYFFRSDRREERRGVGADKRVYRTRVSSEDTYYSRQVNSGSHANEEQRGRTRALTNEKKDRLTDKDADRETDGHHNRDYFLFFTLLLA
jgi:hypothetical protein